MAEIDTATGAGLVEFLNWAGSKGELNLTTANALKGAVGKILRVVDDAPSNVDIRSLDVEVVLGRFETRFRTGYTSGSMSTYKTRFRQAVDMYLAWLDKDPRWRTVVKSRRTGDTSNRQTSSAARTSRTTSPAPTPPPTVNSVVEQPGSARTSNQLVVHHLPLRPDLLVQVELPVRLTRADADRLAAFVKSLAFEDSSASVANERLLSDLDDNEGGD